VLSPYFPISLKILMDSLFQFSLPYFGDFNELKESNHSLISLFQITTFAAYCICNPRAQFGFFAQVRVSEASRGHGSSTGESGSVDCCWLWNWHTRNHPLERISFKPNYQVCGGLQQQTSSGSGVCLQRAP